MFFRPFKCAKLMRLEWLIIHDPYHAFTDASKAELLFLAAQSGHLATVKWLTEKADFGPSELWGALVGAVPCGYVDIAKCLINYKSGMIKFDTKEGQSLLSIAAKRGHLAVVKLLIAAGAHIEHGENECVPVTLAVQAGEDIVAQWMTRYCGRYKQLSDAISSGELKKVKELIARYEVVDANLLKPRKDGGESLVIQALRLGHVDIVYYLCKLNLCTPEITQSCCDVAILLDDVKMVQWLVERNKNETKGAVWVQALKTGGPKVLEWLLHDHTSIDEKVNERTPLVTACENGNASAVKTLLMAKASVNRESGGWSPVIHATLAGHFEIVQFLFSVGASVDKEPISGAFILKAIEKRHFDMIQWAIDQKHVNVDELHSTTRRTALAFSAERGDLEAVKFLMNASASINLPSNGVSPIVYAANRGHLKIVEYLYTAGAVEAKHPISGSVVIHAIENDHLELVKWLIKGHYANVDECTCYNQSPLMVAIERGHIEMVRWLVCEGHADVDRVQIDGTIAVDIAAKKDVEMLLVLLQMGPDLRESTALGNALEDGNVEVVRILVSAGAGIGAFRLHKPAVGMLLDAVRKNCSKKIRRVLTPFGFDRQTANLVSRYAAMTWDETEATLRRPTFKR